MYSFELASNDISSIMNITKIHPDISELLLANRWTSPEMTVVNAYDVLRDDYVITHTQRIVIMASSSAVVTRKCCYRLDFKDIALSPDFMKICLSFSKLCDQNWDS
jgi:hypothetical protein